MRVWVYPEKVYEELGAERWSVQWYTAPRKWDGMEDGDGPSPDEMVCHESHHATEHEARTAARARVEDDYYGCPIVQREVVDWYVEEDRIAEWTSAGDPIYVE